MAVAKTIIGVFLAVHGLVWLVACFLPILHPAVFLIGWLVPWPWIYKLVLLLAAGLAQVEFAITWLLRKDYRDPWPLGWRWLTLIGIIAIAILVVVIVYTMGHGNWETLLSVPRRR
ncbi:MAG: hypothetical protein AB1597_01900 [Chloroflexota bacterium]